MLFVHSKYLDLRLKSTNPLSWICGSIKKTNLDMKSEYKEGQVWPYETTEKFNSVVNNTGHTIWGAVCLLCKQWLMKTSISDNTTPQMFKSNLRPFTQYSLFISSVYGYTYCSVWAPRSVSRTVLKREIWINVVQIQT